MVLKFFLTLLLQSFYDVPQQFPYIHLILRLLLENLEKSLLFLFFHTSHQVNIMQYSMYLFQTVMVIKLLDLSIVLNILFLQFHIVSIVKLYLQYPLDCNMRYLQLNHNYLFLLSLYHIFLNIFLVLHFFFLL